MKVWDFSKIENQLLKLFCWIFWWIVWCYCFFKWIYLFLLLKLSILLWLWLEKYFTHFCRNMWSVVKTNSQKSFGPNLLFPIISNLPIDFIPILTSKENVYDCKNTFMLLPIISYLCAKEKKIGGTWGD